MRTLLAAFSLFAVIILTNGCQTDPVSNGTADEKSILIVDEAVEAMGGWDAWNDARFFTFNFFGDRKWYFDKQNNRYRMENNNPKVIITGVFGQPESIQSHSVPRGKVANAVEQYAREVENFWRNDSYWIFMPFKLRDSGVSLKYVGEKMTKAGALAQVVEVTFSNVGDTPNNKYHVYFDNQTKLVAQWDFFRDLEAKTPSMINPWTDYKKTGCNGLLLSKGRGQRSLTEVECLSKINEELFSQ